MPRRHAPGTSASVSLARRWQDFARSWATYALYSWRDLIDFADSPAKRDRRRVNLDIERLEIRELPAFAASLFATSIPDPLQAAGRGVGDFRVGLLDGGVSTAVPVDFHRNLASGPQAALVYNSATVAPKPVIAVQLTSAGGDAVPTSIDAVLTWNGSAQATVTFATTGHSSGDDYLLSTQASSAVTTTGYYAYSVALTAHFSGTGDQTFTVSGSVPVVARDTSSDVFGRGWGVSNFGKIVTVTGGLLYVYGTGGARFFSGSGVGNYTSPANDFGTLAKNVDSTYTYTALDQVKTYFDSAGKQTKIVETHGLTVTFSYDGSNRLSAMKSFDGGIATFTYDGGGLLDKVQMPGSRTVTVAHASGSDLTTATLPDGGLQTFAYDASHRLTSKHWLDQRTTFTYDGTTGFASTADRGSSVTTVTLAPAVGLAASPAKNVSDGVTVWADPLNRKTTYTLDSVGRATQVTTADGGVTQYTLNSAGLPTKVTDQLSRVTTFTYATNLPDVTKIEYPDGGVVTMTYHATFHKVTEHIDPLGNRSTFTYDATTGHILTRKDALGGTTTYGYTGGGFPPEPTPAGAVVSITDPLGRITTFGYDLSTRRLTSVRDPLNNLTTYTYTAAGWLTRVDAPFVTYVGGGLGGGASQSATSTTITYDAMGRRTVAVDAEGATTTYTYNALGQVTSVTDPLGRQTTYAYDTRGNRTGMTEAAGTGDERRTTATYDAADQQLTAVNGRGNTTTFSYDAVGRLTATQNPLGNRATTVYDAAGQVTAVVDALNHRTTFSYDAVGRRTVVQNALGDRTTTAYDLAGNVRSVTDALGVVTSFAYDALNRPTRQIDDKGGSLERTTTATYDAIGNVLTVVNGRGYTTTYTYDALNRESTRTDALGHVTTTQYDAVLRQVSQAVDSLGNTTTYTYDKVGRLTVTERPGSGGVFTCVYDGAGNNTVRVDELGHTTTFTYDNLNRLTVQTDALSGKTTFAYDAANNRTLAIDPVGNRTTFVYDAANRLTQRTDPLGNNTTNDYDAANRVTRITDPSGAWRNFSYDDVNRKLTELYYNLVGVLDQTQTFTYDALGRLLSAVDPDGSNTFTYDALGRRVTAQEPFGLSLTYTYDAANNRTAVQDSQGGRTTYTYNAANLLTNVKFTGNGTTISFDAAYTVRDEVEGITRYSDITGTTKVGTTSFTYDARGRLTNLWHKNGAGSNVENTTYTYDNHDRLGTKVVDGTTTTYTYDDTDQLTNDGAAYTYDANGNRTMSGYATDTGNRMTNDGTYTYTYDVKGNRTKKSKGASLETWIYSYDNQNHLMWIEKRASDGGALQLRVAYKYDALGHRVERTEDSDGNGTVDVTQRFGYDGADVWADLDGSNALVTRRLFGAGVNAPVARISAVGTVAWYLTDHQHSVTVMVDNTGAVQDRITYDGFGKIVSETNSGFGDRYKYTGREWDGSVQLLNAGHRYYDPSSGTWIGRHLSGLHAGNVNLYRFYNNNPTGAKLGGRNWWSDAEGWLDTQLQNGMNWINGVRPGTAESIGGPVNAGSWGGGLGGGLAGAGSAVWSVATSRPQVLLNPWGLLAVAAAGAAVGVATGCDQGAAAGDDWWAGFEIGGQAGAENGAVAGQIAGAIAGAIDGLTGDGGNVGQCFPAGTLVATEDGRVPIERLATGDRVWSFDFRRRLWRTCAVMRTFERLHDGQMVTVTVGAEEITATADHPFWVVNGEDLAGRPAPKYAPITEFEGRVEGRWVLAKDLQVGDDLLLRTGETLAIDRLAVAHEHLPVYNFHVEELENYAVGCSEILVHNDNGDSLVGPDTVYHGSPQQPDTIFAEGLLPPGDDMDLDAHISGNTNSGFVSTTGTINDAAPWAGNGGWVYEIQTPGGGVDIGEYIGGYGPYGDESEIAFPRPIPPGAIIGAHQVGLNEIPTGVFIENPWFGAW